MRSDKVSIRYGVIVADDMLALDSLWLPSGLGYRLYRHVGDDHVVLGDGMRGLGRILCFFFCVVLEATVQRKEHETSCHIHHFRYLHLL